MDFSVAAGGCTMTISPFIGGVAKVVAVGTLMAGGAGGIYIVSRTDDGNDATQVVAETATAETATADISTPAPLLPTPFPPAIITVLTPVPASDIRSDCDASFVAIADDQLSICFPAGWRATTTLNSPAPGGGRSYSLTGPSLLYIGFGIHDGPAMFGSIRNGTPVALDALSSTQELCAILSRGSAVDFIVSVYPLADRGAVGCVGQGDTGEGGVNPTYLYAPWSGGNHLTFYITRTTADAKLEDELRAVLATLKAASP
jgi:hypothetical protein